MKIELKNKWRQIKTEKYKSRNAKWNMKYEK